MSPKSKSHQLDLFADDAKVTAPVEKAAAKPHPRCARCSETFLSDHEVAARYAVSRAAIWRWVKSNPEFPKPHKLSAGTTRWKLIDLVNFEIQKERDAIARLKTKVVGVPP